MGDQGLTVLPCKCGSNDLIFGKFPWEDDAITVKITCKTCGEYLYADGKNENTALRNAIKLWNEKGEIKDDSG